ncbi:hypothetical protein BGS_0805 [Beggiatoa sp. SS]|nr:hypothetical protein BGS_0805 [Beggiatoa sp. SS]
MGLIQINNLYIFWSRFQIFNNLDIEGQPLWLPLRLKHSHSTTPVPTNRGNHNLFPLKIYVFRGVIPCGCSCVKHSHSTIPVPVQEDN